MDNQKKSRIANVNTATRFSNDIRRCLFLSLLLVLVSAALTVFRPTILSYLDNRFFDIMLQSLPMEQVHPTPVVVSIDDKSLRKFGQWPWSRSLLARLLRETLGLGASTIGLDLILSEPERMPAGRGFDNAMAKDRSISVKESAEIESGDWALARLLIDASITLGYKFLFAETQTGDIEKLPHPLKNAVLHASPSYPIDALQAVDALCNIPEFSRAATGSGFVNAGADTDGVLRRVPLFIQYKGDLFPNLALASLIMHTGRSDVLVESNQDGMTFYWNGRKIPLDENGNYLLRYKGRKNTFPHYSAADILDGSIPSVALKDKIVFIGATASGLGDWHVSPLDNRFPGPEIHATIVDNLLSNDFLARPRWADGAELFAVFLLGGILSLSMSYGNSVVGFTTAVVSASSVVLLFYLLFHKWGIYLSPVMPLSTIFIMFSGVSILNFGYAEHRSRRRMTALIQAQNDTIIKLAALAETRDPETGRHLQRTQMYVQALAEELSKNPAYGITPDAEYIDLLTKSAPLHDIGKVGIPDDILLKKGKLTTAEYEEMKNHALIGARVLSGPAIETAAETTYSYLELGRQMALSHHEKWDGSGYPEGLKGEDIPLAGRIMALVDVYDALTTKRTYKPAFSHEYAREIIIQEKGRHFDPKLVEAFLNIEAVFISIANDFEERL